MIFYLFTLLLKVFKTTYEELHLQKKNVINVFRKKILKMFIKT